MKRVTLLPIFPSFYYSKAVDNFHEISGRDGRWDILAVTRIHRLRHRLLWLPPHFIL